MARRRKKRQSSIVHLKYRFHAHNRLKKRYDTKISVKDLVRCIRDNEISDDYKVIENKKVTCSRNEMIVEYKGDIYRLIYSKTARQIVTFLPLKDEE